MWKISSLVPACNLYLEATYDDASAKALVKVTIKYTSDVTSVNHLECDDPEKRHC